MPYRLSFTRLGIWRRRRIVAGLAAGMEFKDRAWGGKWDWLDIAADAIGTLVGEIVHFAIFKRW
jgi:hypothetical protein